MTTHVDAALFVYARESEHLIPRLKADRASVSVREVGFDSLMEDPGRRLEGVQHVVVSGSVAVVKSVLGLSLQHGFSVGIIALPSQRDLLRGYGFASKRSSTIDLSLRCNPRAIDRILCNDEIVLCTATIGRLPLLGSATDQGRAHVLRLAEALFRAQTADVPIRDRGQTEDNDGGLRLHDDAGLRG